MQQEQPSGVYDSGIWLELLRALVYQLFFLPDLKSHIEATVLIFNTYAHVRQSQGVIAILEDLSKESFYDTSNQAPRMIANVRQCLTAPLTSQDFLTAHNFLLRQVTGVPEDVFPKDSLAYIYYQRGLAYFALHKYTQASADLNQAIEDLNESIKLNPNDVWAYVLRGLAHLWLKDIQAAINDYTSSPRNLRSQWMFEWIGMCQARSRLGEEVAGRLEEIADSDDQPPLVPACRGVAHWLRSDQGYVSSCLRFPISPFKKMGACLHLLHFPVCHPYK